MTLVLEAVTGYLAQLWASDVGRGCVECGWWVVVGASEPKRAR